MHHHLIDFVIFLSAAVIVVPLFRAFKLGAILAYLFAGVLIGPQVLSFIKDPQTILSFSELGVVFLLFLIGLELQPSRLWKMRRNVFGMGLLQVMITGGLLWAFSMSVGLDKNAAFLAGFGLALSSTAFAIQILEEKHQMKTLHGEGSFSILLLQDLAVVPLIAIVPLLTGEGISSSPTWVDALKIIGIVGGLTVFGLFFIRHICRFVAQARVQEVFTAMALLIVVGAALLMEHAGLSMGMGAFLAGVVLANSEYRHELESNLQPFKGLLLGLFFIAVGMSLDLSVLVERPVTIAWVVLSFMFIKALVIFLIGRTFRFPYESSRNMAFTLPQGGEFAFVLFAAGLSAGIIDHSTSSVLNASVTLSMALTPLFFTLNQRYLRTYSEVSERPTDKIESEGAQVIIAGYGRFGQIVGRFLGIEGISYTILEHSASQVDTARRFGTKIYYGDASRVDILESAGAKEARTFVLAIDDPDTSVQTAKVVKEHFPHMHIIARVRNRQHAIEMLKLGIENIHRETYLTSLEVAKEVLLDIGKKREHINKRLAIFRQNDEGILRQQYELRDDQKKLMSFTRQANQELEGILRAEIAKLGKEDSLPEDL